MKAKTDFKEVCDVHRNSSSFQFSVYFQLYLCIIIHHHINLVCTPKFVMCIIIHRNSSSFQFSVYSQGELCAGLFQMESKVRSARIHKMIQLFHTNFDQ